MAIDYNSNRRYFSAGTGKLKAGIILSVIGVFLFFFIGKSVGIGVFGLLFLAAGIGLIYLHVKGGVTDESLDRQVDTESANIVNEGLSKLGLDLEQVSLIDPLMVSGYNFRSGVPWKKGKDGVWRTGEYEVVVLYFNEAQVYTYTKKFSLVQDGSVSSLQDEYFYKDIVSIAVAENHGQTPTGESFTSHQFLMRNTGGEAVTSSVRNDSGEFQQRVSASRQLLREKKNV